MTGTKFDLPSVLNLKKALYGRSIYKSAFLFWHNPVCVNGNWMVAF
jgi:hypothetical protein